MLRIKKITTMVGLLFLAGVTISVGFISAAKLLLIPPSSELSNISTTPLVTTPTVFPVQSASPISNQTSVQLPPILTPSAVPTITVLDTVPAIIPAITTLTPHQKEKDEDD